MKALKISILAIALLAPFTILGKSFFVSPTAKATGIGTLTSPYTLSIALSHPVRIAAGDTIFLTEGTYVGRFISYLEGSEGKPIVVMPFHKDKVIIDGNTGVTGSESTLNLSGSYASFYNLYITNSTLKRDETIETINMNAGVDIYGSNIKLINCIIYENPNSGVGAWSTAVDSEIYGCVIINNGYQGSDRGHGHGIYTQNDLGTKQIKDNFILNGFQYGFHAYTSKGKITGYNIEGNVSFNNGVLQKTGEYKANLLIGGYTPSDRITINQNHFYHPLTTGSKNFELGYSGSTVANEEVAITGNTIHGGINTSTIMNWNKITFTSNSVISNYCFANLTLNGVDPKTHVWNNNKYFAGATNASFCGTSFATWKSTNGFDANSTHTSSLPKQNQIVVRPNIYEAGRANIVVYNWTKLNEVSVDLSKVLTKEATYYIYDVQNILGLPIATGTYNGYSVTIPMTSTAVKTPSGNVPGKPVHTSKEFGTFIVISDNGSTQQAPTAIKKIEESKTQISISPNPASSKININYPNNTNESEVLITIYNVNGQVQQSQLFALSSEVADIEMDVNNLKNGLYIVKAGEQSHKLIIRH